MCINSQHLMILLDQLGIGTTTVEHPPLRTIEDGRRLRGNLEGGHAKSLFLKDKKGGYWLITALEKTRIDLRLTASLLRVPRFSFANEEELGQWLGVVPGAVSPFAAANDVHGRVCVVFERRALDAGLLNCHPLRNDRTTAIATVDLLKFLDRVDHPPRIIDLPD